MNGKSNLINYWLDVLYHVQNHMKNDIVHLDEIGFKEL